MSDKIDINVNAMRDPAIELYGLPATDEARTFYYDETNNHRLVRLVDTGLNVADPRPFVLGGVVHTGPKRPIDLGPLRAGMRIPAAVAELKFDKVAWGDFPAVLGSHRLTTFLSWLAAEGFLLHFITVDPVYYSYVDIIDSMPATETIDFPGRMILKNDLYRVLREDAEQSLAMLRRFSYPAVAGGDVRGFLEELIAVLDAMPNAMPIHHRMMLKGVLQSGRRLSSLPLLDDAPHVLMAGFDSMFTHRLCLFKASEHVLDDEDVVSKVLQRYRFVDDGRPLDFYRFVDSKAEPGVQLADVVVGLLGACLVWLRDLDDDAILEAKRGFTATQGANRAAFADLVKRSIGATSAFVQNVLSIDDIRRFEFFLEY